MNTDLGQDSVDQLAFWQREIKIMIAGRDVAQEQCHPDLCQGGHASAHDPHPPSCHTSCKVLSRNAQQLAYGLFIKSQSLVPPFTELATLPLLQDQRMPQELIDGIFIIGDPLAPHPGALIPDSFLGGPCIHVEFHDYL